MTKSTRASSELLAKKKGPTSEPCCIH